MASLKCFFGAAVLFTQLTADYPQWRQQDSRSRAQLPRKNQAGHAIMAPSSWLIQLLAGGKYTTAVHSPELESINKRRIL